MIDHQPVTRVTAVTPVTPVTGVRGVWVLKGLRNGEERK